jgi:SpoVK/Ycf46/Vps4 family AAA+-type ATPase
MPSDPSVIAALEAAVAGDPGNLALRLHLAVVLLDSARPGEALAHAERVLSAKPDHVEALAIAAQAADQTGDVERARAWRNLHAALAGPGGDVDPAQVRVGQDAPDNAESGEDWDAFLSEVLGDPGEEGITLADVGGLDDVKRRLHTSFLGPLRNPKLRRMYGKSLRGGLLLWGPPGCGKTFLARAVAGELGARFINIGLNDVLDMWLGKSEQNLHSIFDAARRQMPCVLFIDELDALGHKRTNLVRSAGRNVVVQLLSELDGVAQDNEGLFMLGGTNQPWDVDPALRRPGRFDRTVLVLPPDEAARQAILQFHLRDRPVDTIDLGELARRTERFSGADLRLLCEAGAEHALEESIESGDARPIRTADLLAALRDIRPSIQSWFDVARNFAIYSNESGEYDDLLAYMRRHRLG